MPDRDLDVLVLGATGITGRLVTAHLAARAAGAGVRWGVAGRDEGRLRRTLAAAQEDAGTDGATDGATDSATDGVAVLRADLTDDASLTAAAARTRVLLNLTGPYTDTGDAVIGACVAAGAHYLDLSGELPAVGRSTRRWDAAARAAGTKVVQVAGYESLPMDLAVLLASERAAATGRRVAAVDVVVATTPPGRVRLGETVSGGTVQSLVRALADADAARIADPALLVAAGGDDAGAAAVRRASPVALAPVVRSGRVLAPALPAAFVTPPVVHRTASLLAAEAGLPVQPFAYAERSDLGPAGPSRVGRSVRLAAAGGSAAGQAAVLAAARLPTAVRAPLARLAGRLLPASGTGPTGPRLEQWRWQLRATARTAPAGDGPVVVTIDAHGHPGYLAAARMLAEAGLALAEPGATPARAGCLTPAVALGTGVASRLRQAGLDVRVEG